jgi:hypothetical protein
MTKAVKIYGERNSGNIYLEWLLAKNLEVELINSPAYGWKHRLAPQPEELTVEMKESAIFACLIKNPYSWVLSMHKRPYNHESLRKLSFGDFLKYSFGDYQNPIAMWNLKNQSYLKLAEYVPNHIIFRYEDLVADFKEQLNRFADQFNIEKPELYKNINNLLTHSHGIKSQSFHREYYLEERWKFNLRGKHIDFINEQLDQNLMQKLNYSYL